MNHQLQQPQLNLHTTITYHVDLGRHFEACSWFLGMAPDALHHATEANIRQRHHTDAIIDEGDHAHGRQPDVFNLDQGQVRVYYTIESGCIVVRGYLCEPEQCPQEGRDCRDYYSYICEPAWYPEKTADWFLEQIASDNTRPALWVKRAFKNLIDSSSRRIASLLWRQRAARELKTMRVLLNIKEEHE